MDVRAAVAFEAGKPLSIETVQLEGPRAGEVLVEIKAAALNRAVETAVRRIPSQYLWSYKRFKSRPEGLPKVYRRRRS